MVYIWIDDSEVCKYERWKPHHNSEYFRGYIIEVFVGYKSDCTYQWRIELEGKLISSVSIVNVSEYDQKSTLGYCLARKHWANGYTTEAVKSILRYMFIEIGLNRIEASYSINNIALG